MFLSPAVLINSALTYLDCGGDQLTSLDVSNCTALEWLNISGMPKLYEVCVWEVPIHQIDLSPFQKGVYIITVRYENYVRID